MKGAIDSMKYFKVNNNGRLFITIVDRRYFCSNAQKVHTECSTSKSDVVFTVRQGESILHFHFCVYFRHENVVAERSALSLPASSGISFVIDHSRHNVARAEDGKVASCNLAKPCGQVCLVL